MTSIILSGLKRLDELGSWRALRFSEQFVFWQRTETKRSYFSLQQLVLGDDTEAITSKITPARILKAKSLFEMERFEQQQERTLLFFAAASPFIFKKSYDLFMMTTKQHHYKNREHKF